MSPTAATRPCHAPRRTSAVATALVAVLASAPALAPRPAIAQRDARVRVVVDTPAVAVGQTVRSSVVVDGMRDLAGYQLTLAWDSERLRDIEIRVDEDFITSSGRSIEFLEPVWGPDRVTFLLFTTAPGPGPTPGVDGEGILIHADFEALEAGEATIFLDEVLLTDSENMPIAAPVLPGTVSIAASRPIYMPVAYGG